MKAQLLLCAALAAAPLAQAESGASSASSAGSAASGSLSNSLQTSSNSSNQRTVAAGDYRIERMAEAGDAVRLDLVPLAEGEPFTLTLPQTVARRQGLAVGGVVTTELRAYGLAFAQGGQPFYLALADDWYGALDARPI